VRLRWLCWPRILPVGTRRDNYGPGTRGGVRPAYQANEQEVKALEDSQDDAVKDDKSAKSKGSSSPGKSVALGLDRGPAGNDLLQPFADNLGASTNRDWIKDGLVTPTIDPATGRIIGPDFETRFGQATSNSIESGGRIAFNLDHFSINDGLAADTSEGAYGDGGFTNWEFQQILSSPTLFPATDWYIGPEMLSPEDVTAFGIGPR
jgi:hypothetical protein